MSDETGEESAAAPKNRRRRVALGATVSIVVVLAGLMLLLVFPTRAWIAQRREEASIRHRLALISEQNNRLQQQVDALHTPTEIARVAREQYHLVLPGEQAVAVLPSPTPNVLPAQWPYDLVRSIVEARAVPPPPPAADTAPVTTSAPSPTPG